MKLQRTLAVVLSLGCLAIPALSFANDPAAAEVLFREGRKLMDAGKLEEACPKLAESQRIDPSSGTLGSLALCHEKQGRLATAWAEYLAAAQLARVQKNENRAKEAEKRAATLLPQLSYVTIKLADKPAGLVLTRDEEKVESAVLGTRLPIDPGEHTFRAEAPGFSAVTLKVSIPNSASDRVVEIPALTRVATPTPSASAAVVPSAVPSATAAPSVTATASAPPDRPPPVPPRSAPVAGYVIGAVGVVGLGVGTYFGLSSLSTYSKAKDACPTRTGCSQDALNQRDSAGTKANISNIGLGVGVVGVAVGSYLIFFRGNSTAASQDSGVRVGATVVPGAGMFSLGGGF